MTDILHEGGCFCGAVRYAASGSPLRVMHCHCSICRKTSAAPLVTWITFPVGAFRWTQGQARVLNSTATANRNFCAQCGSHMAFAIDGGAELDITLASFDHPDAFAPQYHIFNDTRVEWLSLADHLPAYDDWGPDLQPA